MIALLQRVRSARVEVDGVVVGAIDQGLLMFVCAEPADTVQHAQRLIDKVLKLRIFNDAIGKMNLNLQTLRNGLGGGLLVVSQFTLAADTTRGNRPGFGGAAPAAPGRMLYEALLQMAHERHPVVQAGVFGADMQVHLVNDGPVTIPLQVS